MLRLRDGNEVDDAFSREITFRHNDYPGLFRNRISAISRTAPRRGSSQLGWQFQRRVLISVEDPPPERGGVPVNVPHRGRQLPFMPWSGVQPEGGGTKAPPRSATRRFSSSPAWSWRLVNGLRKPRSSSVMPKRSAMSLSVSPATAR